MLADALSHVSVDHAFTGTPFDEVYGSRGRVSHPLRTLGVTIFFEQKRECITLCLYHVSPHNVALKRAVAAYSSFEPKQTFRLENVVLVV